jgi:hypothetical protein
MPQMIALTATVSRRTMRPMPGQRSGKLEKSLGSECLLGAQTCQQETSFFRPELDPQIECFFGTSRRFSHSLSGVWVELEMYEPASNSYSDGLGAIACTEFLHDVLNMSLYCFL